MKNLANSVKVLEKEKFPKRFFENVIKNENFLEMKNF